MPGANFLMLKAAVVSRPLKLPLLLFLLIALLHLQPNKAAKTHPLQFYMTWPQWKFIRISRVYFFPARDLQTEEISSFECRDIKLGEINRACCLTRNNF